MGLDSATAHIGLQFTEWSSHGSTEGRQQLLMPALRPFASACTATKA